MKEEVIVEVVEEVVVEVVVVMKSSSELDSMAKRGIRESGF